MKLHSMFPIHFQFYTFSCFNGIFFYGMDEKFNSSTLLTRRITCLLILSGKTL